MSAQKLLVIGESGTGKSCSIRTCDPATTAILSPEKEQLPFRSKGYEILIGTTDSTKICRWMDQMAEKGKKIIVIDDFQYILAIPYMARIHEGGWDKYNDFSSNYFEIIEECKKLPDDVVVAFLSHGETLPESGLFTVKLIGKLLREKITIEGLYGVVLRTMVQDGKYYFLTQNSGHDTVKSPMGMFDSYAIDNDLNYVVDKIRNYYGIKGAKSDEEMAQADEAVKKDVEKPDAGGRRTRKPRRQEEEPKAENEPEEVPFTEDSDANKKLDPSPARRTRKAREVKPKESEPVTEDTYLHTADGNYITIHPGEIIPDGAQIISHDEYVEGCKALAQQNNPVDPISGMNKPNEAPRRRRRRA